MPSRSPLCNFSANQTRVASFGEIFVSSDFKNEKPTAQMTASGDALNPKFDDLHAYD
jgi:hypothetical protein